MLLVAGDQVLIVPGDQVLLVPGDQVHSVLQCCLLSWLNHGGDNDKMHLSISAVWHYHFESIWYHSDSDNFASPGPILIFILAENLSSISLQYRVTSMSNLSNPTSTHLTAGLAKVVCSDLPIGNSCS